MFNMFRIHIISSYEYYIFCYYTSIINCLFVFPSILEYTPNENNINTEISLELLRTNIYAVNMYCCYSYI